ncbi:MAG TPA: hypothetical protein VEW94_13735 [Chloroflexia bacterium]|nr:hypothetical protein [Chloroflexia bacterium]
MKRARVSMVAAALAVIGLGAVLYGCGEGGSASAPEDEAAKQQFLSERGKDATPGTMTDTISYGNGGPGSMPPGIFGTVEKVDGSNISVKSDFDGKVTTLQIAADAKIHKQVDAQPSDIKQGESVMVVGDKNGEVVEARLVQIGVPDGAPGGPMVVGKPGSAGGPDKDMVGGGPVIVGGAPPDGGLAAGPISPPTFGTVEKVDGNQITLKTREGDTLTVQLSDYTRLQKQAEIKASGINAGDTLTAIGTQNGDVFEATTVQIISGSLKPAP